MVRAFHAEGSERVIHHGSTIKFRNVKINMNGCYNPASSIFTCKDKGLYYFYVTITTYGGKGYGQVWFMIVQDGRNRGYGVSGRVGGIFAMIRCSPGSHVWVKQSGYKPSWIQAMWGGHSQFGGFKIAK